MKKIIGKANKKAQIALWIILAVILAASITLFFIVQRRPTIEVKAEFSPEQYIKKCTAESVEEAVGIMLPQGGFLEPKNYKIYNDTKIEYLCQNEEYYKPCVNKHPMFLSEMAGQIKSYIEPNVESCFQSMKAEAEKKNIIIEMDAMGINASLAPGKILVNIARRLTIIQDESRKTIDEIDVDTANPLYDIANVAMEIANNEAKYCYFESIGYMLLYERWNIRKFPMSDSTKIYIIKDNYSGTKMNFAIRSCAQPPGWGGL